MTSSAQVQPALLDVDAPPMGVVDNLTGADRNDTVTYSGYRGGHPEEAERPRGRRATSAV